MPGMGVRATAAEILRGLRLASRTASWWCGPRDIRRWRVRRRTWLRRDICWRRYCGVRYWCGVCVLPREAADPRDGRWWLEARANPRTICADGELRSLGQPRAAVPT